jgi:hypothetical protein
MYKFKLADGKAIEYPRSEVKRVAQDIGLDLQHDAEKYDWFLRHALTSLMPTEWRKEKDPTGKTQFHNTKTQVTSKVHPLTYKFRSAFMRLVNREAVKEQPTITDVDVRALLKKETIKSRRLGTNVDINILSVEEQLKAFEDLVNKQTTYQTADPGRDQQAVYETDEYYQILMEGWEAKMPDYVLTSIDYLQADPMAVYEASRILCIKDFRFVWVARLMLAMPLPPLWMKVKDTHGTVMYLNSDRDITDPHHPSINEIRKLLAKIEAQGTTNDTILEFYDKKFIKRTVDAAALWRGVLKVLEVSEQPDLEVLSKVSQKSSKLSVEDTLDDVMVLELARVAGVNYKKETHLLNYVFMFLDSMREQQRLKGWEFRYTVEGKKYWYHPETKRPSVEFPFKKVLHTYIKRAREQLSLTYKQKLRQPSSMHYLYDYHGDDLYKKARTMAKRVMERWMERYFEDSDEEAEDFDASALLEYVGEEDQHSKAVSLMFACPFQFEDLRTARLQVEEYADSDSDVTSKEPDSQTDEDNSFDYSADEETKQTDTKSSANLLLPPTESKGNFPRPLLAPVDTGRLSIGSPNAQASLEPIILHVPPSVHNPDTQGPTKFASKLDILNLYKASTSKVVSKLSLSRASLDSLPEQVSEKASQPQSGLSITDRILASSSLGSLKDEDPTMNVFNTVQTSSLPTQLERREKPHSHREEDASFLNAQRTPIRQMTPLQSQMTTPLARSQLTTPFAQSQMTTPLTQSLLTTPLAQSQLTTPLAQSQMTTPLAQSQMTTPLVQSQMTTPLAQSHMTTPLAQSRMTTPLTLTQISTPLTSSQMTPPFAEQGQMSHSLEIPQINIHLTEHQLDPPLAEGSQINIPIPVEERLRTPLKFPERSPSVYLSAISGLSGEEAPVRSVSPAQLDGKTSKIRKDLLTSVRTLKTSSDLLSIFGRSLVELPKIKSPSSQALNESLSKSQIQHKQLTNSFIDDADSLSQPLHTAPEQSSPELQVDPSTLQLISDEVLRHSMEPEVLNLHISPSMLPSVDSRINPPLLDSSSADLPIHNQGATDKQTKRTRYNLFEMKKSSLINADEEIESEFVQRFSLESAREPDQKHRLESARESVKQISLKRSHSNGKLHKLPALLEDQPRYQSVTKLRGRSSLAKLPKEFIIPINDHNSMGFTERRDSQTSIRKKTSLFHDSALNEVNFVHYLEWVGNPTLDRKSLARFESPKVVTPILVYAMARRLGIKTSVKSLCSVESDLMWIAQLQLVAPAPFGFSVPADFAALLSMQLFEHPGDEYFLLMLKSHRKRRNDHLKHLTVKARPRDLTLNSWLQFKSVKGATYYFNFMNGKTSSSYPGFYSSLGSIL